MMAVEMDNLPTLPPTGGLRPSPILTQTLRSAHFWELGNMRNALLSSINDGTSALDKAGITDTQSLPASEKMPIDATQLRRAISAFEMLLYFPFEYLSRSARQDLTRRAFTADFILCLTMHAGGFSEANIMRSMTILRVFLKRWLLYQSFAYAAVSPILQATPPVVFDFLTYRSLDNMCSISLLRCTDVQIPHLRFYLSL